MGIIQGQFTIDFIGGHMMVPHASQSTRIDKRKRAPDIGIEKGRRVIDGIIVVSLGGAVHHGIRFGNKTAHELGIANVPNNQAQVLSWNSRQVLGITGVRELVEHGNCYVGMLADYVANQIRAYETASAGH